MTLAENILLTGAGFTHNFGGFLAERMWTEIFNHPDIQRSQLIREMMLSDFNYESIYDKVLYESSGLRLSEQDRDAIKTAVHAAYEKLDTSIIDFQKAHMNKVIALRGLMRLFVGDNNAAGLFFTLNQDIFIERFYDGYNKPLRLPGLSVQETSLNSLRSRWPQKLQDEDIITLEKSVDTMPIKGSLSTSEFNYIKLHGSFNWRSSTGSEAMVIGMDKESSINREPLLKSYLEIFREALSYPNRRLIIIGYSFRDKHINEVIKDAINNFRLKVIVVSAESPRQFVDKFFGVHGTIPRLPSKDYPFGETILSEGLTGYFPFELNEDTIVTLAKTLFL